MKIRNSLSLLYEGRKQDFSATGENWEGFVSRRNLSQDIIHIVGIRGSLEKVRLYFLLSKLGKKKLYENNIR